MIRSRFPVFLLAVASLAGFAAGLAPAADAAEAPVSTPVAAPFQLAIHELTWNGDPHAMPVGRALLAADGQPVWELAEVTAATASADGGTVALLTRDYQVFVSRLPEPPQRVAGGPYISPALSADGTLLAAQRLGSGGHILDRIFRARGIVLVNLVSGEDRMVLEGNDLYAPSFASDQMLFFGSGGPEQYASLYLLDLASDRVARVTNREPDARQGFPSEAPRLAGGTVVYRSDDELFQVAAPAPDDFGPFHRFDSPRFAPTEGISPDFGTVRIRRPSTQTNVSPKIYNYYDLNRSVGPIDDYTCGNWTYDQHGGTDFKQYIGWEVVAPASGRVILRYDGCPNTKVVSCGTGWGNFAALEHTDGSISLEAHGMIDTVAPLGAWLACGAKLMLSASSGNSNAQHIHHESWVDRTGNVNRNLRYDPYQGSCDSSDPSKWGTQNGYKQLPSDTCTH